MVTQTRITSTCKSRFKAKPTSIRLEDKTHRALMFDYKTFKKVKSNYEIVNKIEIKTETENSVTLVTPVTLPRRTQTPITDHLDVKITPRIENSIENSDKKNEKSTIVPTNKGLEDHYTLPKSVTTITSVTKQSMPSAISAEVKTDMSVRCFQCYFKTEGFFLKVHEQNTHGTTQQQLRISESKPSEYKPYGFTYLKNGDVDVSQFIMIIGFKLNDQVVYDAHPAEGNITLVNNFLTGTLRMRGKSNGQYPHNYLEFIDRMFGNPAPELIIEVCSNKIPGETKGGNCITVDINPKYEPDMVGDGQVLEGIRSDYFERWRCDPPYNEKTAKEMYNCELPSLSRLLEAGARVIKPGSLIFLLCSKNVQSGTIGKGNIKRIGFINISVVPNNETRILNIYVKLPENQEASNE
jgi:hypothetical protein